MINLIIDIIISFVFSFPIGSGVGGAGLLTTYFSVFKNMNQLTSQGINLLCYIFTGAAALFIHIQKRKINFPLVIFLSVCGILGSLSGSLFASLVNEFLLRKIFGIFLIFAALLSIFNTLRRNN